MPSMTVTSAAMRRLRCKLQSSRIVALAPTGGVVAKKAPASSSPPSCEYTAPPPKPPRPSSTSTGSAGSTIYKGAKVRVRTSAGQLRTGQRLVLVLDAVVFSAAEDGGYVVYNGNPLVTMRVGRDEVKLMPPADAT